MEKQAAVYEGEVGLSTSILDAGFALGSMFPQIDNFTSKHVVCAGAGGGGGEGEGRREGKGGRREDGKGMRGRRMK